MGKKYIGYKIEYINILGTEMEFFANAADAPDAIKKLREHRGGIKKIVTVTPIARLRC